MRVAWVTSQHPSPRAGAGEVLEFEYLRWVAQTHEVHLISAGLDPGMVDGDLESAGITYEGVPWTADPPPRNRVALARRLVLADSGVIFWRQGNRVQALSRALTVYQERYPTDLVQVVMSDSAPVLAAAEGPRVLFLFDAFSRHLEREYANALRLRDVLRWRLELAKVRDWEKRWYRYASRVACNSSVDAAALEALLHRPVDTVPNPIGDAFFEPGSVERSNNVVALIATLDYRPNVDAVLWFTETMWPRIRQSCPQAVLRIVGRSPIREVCEAADRVGATLHPNVPDVRPYYWEAAVAVAPIRLGTGMRNKVLHAMACGTPVVATPTAVEGIGAPAGSVAIEADPEGFADAVVGAMRNPASASAQAQAARRFVAGLRMHAVGDALVEWWNRAIGEP